MFRLHTVAREERERICKGYEQKHLHPIQLTSNPNWWLLWLQQTTFSKFANFNRSKFKISLVWCHLTKLLHHLTHVPNFYCFSFLQSNLWQDMNLFCLHLVFLCRNDKCLLSWPLVNAPELSHLTCICTQRF